MSRQTFHVFSTLLESSPHFRIVSTFSLLYIPTASLHSLHSLSGVVTVTLTKIYAVAVAALRFIFEHCRALDVGLVKNQICHCQAPDRTRATACCLSTLDRTWGHCLSSSRLHLGHSLSNTRLDLGSLPVKHHTRGSLNLPNYTHGKNLLWLGSR